MIEKTEAIPLIWHEVSNSSRIVHWFTRGFGRVGTLIKGAVRPRSAFLGQYDLYSTSELLFYSRHLDDIHIAKECSLLAPRLGLRQSWRAHLVASALASILLRCTPPLASAPLLFDDFSIALNALNHGHPPRLIQHWTELRFCRELGLQPNFADTCSHCQTVLGQNGAEVAFSPSRGGFLCHRCRFTTTESLHVSKGTMAILRRLQQVALPETLSSLRTNPGQDQELHLLLGRFLAYHLDFHLLARETAHLLASRFAKFSR